MILPTLGEPQDLTLKTLTAGGDDCWIYLALKQPGEKGKAQLKISVEIEVHNSFSLPKDVLVKI